MISGQNLKESSVTILENIYPEIEIGFYQSGGYDRTALDHARDAIDEFIRRILDTEISVNPEFTSMAEFAAELVYFSYSHPDEFSEMFSESAVKWNRDIDIRTAAGVCHLLTFYGSVCDNHDYCLDPKSSSPLLNLLSEVAPPAKSFGPNTLLSILQEYRESLTDPSTALAVSPRPAM